MRVAYVADGRSPISRSWMAHFIEAGHQVHLVSTHDCRPLDGLASLQFVPVAFSRASREAGDGAAPARGSSAARIQYQTDDGHAGLVGSLDDRPVGQAAEEHPG